MRPAPLIEISGHRCAGVDELIELIRVNFAVNDVVNMEDLATPSWEDRGPLIIKTHEVEPDQKLRRLMGAGKMTADQAEKIRAALNRFHVIRPPDSLFPALYQFNLDGREPVYRIPADMNFPTFLRQTGTQDAAPREGRVSYWSRGMRNWIAHPDVTLLRHEDVLNQPAQIAARIAKILGWPSPAHIQPPSPKDSFSADLWSIEAKNAFRHHAAEDVLDLMGYTQNTGTPEF